MEREEHVALGMHLITWVLVGAVAPPGWRRKGGQGMTKRFGIASAIALLALVTLATPASAHGRIIVGGFYGFYPAPIYYGPGWWGPWYGPYGWPGYNPGPVTGTVKIVTNVRHGSIYVDGGYAGTTAKHRKFPLRPGKHTILVRDARGRRVHEERVYVFVGKTTTIHADELG